MRLGVAEIVKSEPKIPLLSSNHQKNLNFTLAHIHYARISITIVKRKAFQGKYNPNIHSLSITINQGCKSLSFITTKNRKQDTFNLFILIGG